MKSSLNFKSIRMAFIVMFIMPAILLAYYTYFNLADPISTAKDMGKVAKLSQLVVVSSELIHELQKERGRSSGFFNSKGMKFASELPAQRNLTNEKLLVLNEFLKSFDADEHGEEIVNNIADIKKRLKGLGEIRNKVSNLTSTAPKLLGFYTKTIGSMINNINAIADLSTGDKELFNTMRTYKNLVEFKERNGIMRAVFAGVFGRGSNTFFLYQRAVSLKADMKLFYENYQLYSTKEQKALYNSTVAGDVVAEADRMVSEALAKGESGSFTVDAGHWFEVITHKINTLKKVEDKIAAEIIDRSSELESGAFKILILTAVIASVVTILILIVVIMVVRSITEPIKKAEEAASKISKGNFNVSFATDKKDEIGNLLRALDSMKESIEAIASQTVDITDSVKAGQLEARGDESIYSGKWLELVHGTNELIEAFVRPLNITADYIDRISDGEMPELIKTDDYNGDFKKITGNLNTMINSISTLISDIDNLVDGISVGKIRTRANSAAHAGDFGKIMNGINQTLNSLVGFMDKIPIPVMLIDTEYKVTYMNTAGAAVANKTPQAAEGLRCYDHFKTSICNTDQCICKVAMETRQESVKETSSMPADKQLELKAYGLHFTDRSGKVVGAMDAFVDQTAAKHAFAKAEKVSDFQSAETENLKHGLKQLAAGELSTRLIPGDGDEDTKDAQHSFKEISDSINATMESMPFTEAIGSLKSLAEGDLTNSMSGFYQGDNDVFKNEVNNSIDAFNKVLVQVRASVTDVTAGANQVSDSSTSLASGAGEQAASLEQITSSMMEIASQTKINAENSNVANQLSDEAKSAAESGSHEMQGLLGAMDDIKKSGKNISQIMKVIDEIAFQTNLLALNAAVEAARAGHHGKGFAVVAEEVRNLAARSAKAGKETADMIEESNKVVEKGIVLAETTNESLNKIRESSVKTADIVGEITRMSNEQAEGISQINEGLRQIDSITQQNSAAAEEEASASEELSGQARMLSEMISKFNLNDNLGTAGLYLGDASDDMF